MKSFASIRPLVLASILAGAACVFSPGALRAQSARAATQPLLDKARMFESRGRMDMAMQTWQQALLADPKSVEALAGLARAAKLNGDAVGAETYLDRIRAINPNDANIVRVESMGFQSSHTAQPVQATEPPENLAKPSAARTPQPTQETAASASTRGRDAEEQAAYNALNAKNYPGAEQRFKAILTREPEDARALAGMGYLRVQQSNFSDAIGYLVRAKEDGAHDKTLDAALESAQFYAVMGHGAASLSQNNLPDAEQQYHAALAMRPTSPDALEALGDTLLKEQKPLAAVEIYQRFVSVRPDAPAAWRGLFLAQAGAGKTAEALATEHNFPAAVRSELMRNPEFVRALASVSSPAGADGGALSVQQHSTQQHTPVAAEIDLQDAWLLFNNGNDAGLYSRLMLLGSRQDLSAEQRGAVQMIWTNWAVRRANQYAAAGDTGRSLAILNAAVRSFPDNPGALRTLAPGYVRAGAPKQAILIFKSQDMTSASVSDYRSAIRSALAAADKKDTKTWLRDGLRIYPKDAEMLALAAEFEQSRGHGSRAADYYRASLSAVPQADARAELARQLSQPSPIGHPAAAQPQELAGQLSSSDSQQKTASSPPSTLGSSSDQVQHSADHAPSPQATSPQEVYGPYVPYVPPARSAVNVPSAASLQPHVEPPHARSVQRHTGAAQASPFTDDDNRYEAHSRHYSDPPPGQERQPLHRPRDSSGQQYPQPASLPQSAVGRRTSVHSPQPAAVPSKPLDHPDAGQPSSAPPHAPVETTTH